MIRKALTFRDLREYLAAIETAALEDVDPPMTRAELDAMPVVVRVEYPGVLGDQLHLGNLYDVEIDPGCSDVDALILDGSYNARHA